MSHIGGIAGANQATRAPSIVEILNKQLSGYETRINNMTHRIHQLANEAVGPVPESPASTTDAPLQFRTQHSTI